MGLKSIFTEIKIEDQNIADALYKREIKIESTINKFRVLFLIFISIFDAIALFRLNYADKTGINYNIIIFFLLAVPLVAVIHYLSKTGKNLKLIKYLSVSLDLGISFFYGISMLFFIEFPLPIAKHTFAVLITITIIFFNSLSILRSSKKIIVYGWVLSIVFNSILYILISIFIINMFSMVLVFTNIIITIMSLFNLWVSEHIVNFFIVNNKLDLANKDIIEKNEILNQQNEEITAQRDEIERQKEIVEMVHKEVSESIDYAKRIQQSILPDREILGKRFSDYFVFFKPKDVVSGDFYWTAHIENHTIITAADCTGHGVPGAFMSMLGASFLREIVEKEYVTHTGVILRKLRKEIIKALKQKGKSGEQKDGMDMAIVSINHETNIVQFSGANNPLYIVKGKKIRVESEAIKLYEYDNPSEFQLYEVKPDKMPIAIYEKMDNFSTHEIQLEKGDRLYMFSDGFADQFGGPKGKKFKYKPFKKLIIDNAELTMDEQKAVLEKTFNSWKGNLEQVDDVVVVGIKI